MVKVEGKENCYRMLEGVQISSGNVEIIIEVSHNKSPIWPDFIICGIIEQGI